MLSASLFPHRRGRACLESALRDIYEHHGFRLEEHQLFGLGAGLHFDYSGSQALEHSRVSVFSPVLDVALLANTGVRFRRCYDDDPRRATRRLRTLLERGEPVAVKLHPRACRAVIDTTPPALVPFLPAHWVVAVAYDAGADTMHFFDNRRQRPYSMPVAEWEAARHGGLEYADPQGAWLELEFPTRLLDPVVSHWTAVAQVIVGMRHTFSPPLNLGLAGIARFARHLKFWPARLGPEHVRDNAHRMLNSLTAAGAVKGAFRTQYALFLAEAATVLDAPGLDKAARHYRECATLWQMVSEELVGVAAAPERVATWTKGSPTFSTLDAVAAAEAEAAVALAAGLPARPVRRAA